MSPRHQQPCLGGTATCSIAVTSIRLGVAHLSAGVRRLRA
jgi:hypothetical protein